MGLDDVVFEARDELIQSAYYWINAYGYATFNDIKNGDFKSLYQGAVLSYNILSAKKQIGIMGARPDWTRCSQYEKYLDADTRFNMMALYIINLQETKDITAESWSECQLKYIEYSKYLAEVYYNYFVVKLFGSPPQDPSFDYIAVHNNASVMPSFVNPVRHLNKLRSKVLDDITFI